jgi:hypothetical protein
VRYPSYIINPSLSFLSVPAVARVLDPQILLFIVGVFQVLDFANWWKVGVGPGLKVSEIDETLALEYCRAPGG